VTSVLWTGGADQVMDMLRRPIGVVARHHRIDGIHALVVVSESRSD
jgi:hypothetical protein